MHELDDSVGEQVRGRREFTRVPAVISAGQALQNGLNGRLAEMVDVFVMLPVFNQFRVILKIPGIGISVCLGRNWGLSLVKPDVERAVGS